MTKCFSVCLTLPLLATLLFAAACKKAEEPPKQPATPVPAPTAVVSPAAEAPAKPKPAAAKPKPAPAKPKQAAAKPKDAKPQAQAPAKTPSPAAAVPAAGGQTQASAQTRVTTATATGSALGMRFSGASEGQAFYHFLVSSRKGLTLSDEELKNIQRGLWGVAKDNNGKLVMYQFYKDYGHGVMVMPTANDVRRIVELYVKKINAVDEFLNDGVLVQTAEPTKEEIAKFLAESTKD